MDKNGIDYVLVSGYVSILFGRSRSSEDIDVIVQKVSKKKFLDLWKSLTKKGFVCITTDDPDDAYKHYLTKRTAVRFAENDTFIPNMELKFPKMALDSWVITNAKNVILNRKTIRISPIELQISYKLFLGGEKDVEDARYIYRLFKETLDQNLLKRFLKNLDKEDMYKRYIV